MATINSDRALAKGLVIGLAKGLALGLATGLALGKHQRDLQSHQSGGDNAVHQVAGACLCATSYDRMCIGRSHYVCICVCFCCAYKCADLSVADREHSNCVVKLCCAAPAVRKDTVLCSTGVLRGKRCSEARRVRQRPRALKHRPAATTVSTKFKKRSSLISASTTSNLCCDHLTWLSSVQSLS